VRDTHESAAFAHHGAGIERPELERLVVQHLARLAVGGEQHLEPSVQPKTVHHVGANTPTRSIARLERNPLDARHSKCAGTTKAGKARTDDSNSRHAGKSSA